MTCDEPLEYIEELRTSEIWPCRTAKRVLREHKAPELESDRGSEE